RASSVSRKDRRVHAYLADLATCCSQINLVSHKRTVLVFVVARRTVLGRRVYTDRFLTDELRRFGFSLKRAVSRRIRRKNTPTVIDRNGAGRGTKRTSTIRRELILVYKRRRTAAPFRRGSCADWNL